MTSPPVQVSQSRLSSCPVLAVEPPSCHGSTPRWLVNAKTTSGAVGGKKNNHVGLFEVEA